MRNDIRFLRRSKEFNLTQTELAKAIGLSPATISAIENGSNTSVYVAIRIARFFGKDVSEIFYFDCKHDSKAISK